MRTYDGHKGDVTVKAVLDGVPTELMDVLTGAQLGMVMSAVNAAYHRGKHDAGAEAIDGGAAVWVNRDGGGCMVTMDDGSGKVLVQTYRGQEHTAATYSKVQP